MRLQCTSPLLVWVFSFLNDIRLDPLLLNSSHSVSPFPGLQAINCYHGLAALGLALDNDTMTQVGRLMLATEIRSVREYYHLRAHNTHLFPPHLQEYGAIGQFAEDAIFYYTLNWACEPSEFPMRHACLVGIQVIPISSISGLFVDQVRGEWIKALDNAIYRPIRTPDI